MFIYTTNDDIFWVGFIISINVDSNSFDIYKYRDLV